jgi:hypothetical protein
VVGEGLGIFLGVACLAFVGVCLGLVGVGCAHGKSNIIKEGVIKLI